jgi:RimJ/RimL family protein N-acetyltransferase
MTRMPYPACVPELTDGLVLLRAHRRDDVPRIVEQCRDPETVRWTTVPEPYRVSDAHDFLTHVEAAWTDPLGSRHWAVEEVRGDGSLLGTIDLRPGESRDTAHTGFGLHPGGRGRGIMSGALRLACRWWFEQGGSRVHWTAVRGNFASWRAAWACGFTHHGTLPGSHPARRGTALDSWQASLGSDDSREPITPWDEPPVLTTPDAGGLRLRPWRDDDVRHLEPRDQPAHYMPARGVLDPESFPGWLLVRRERMSVGTSLNWCIADAASDAALGEVLVFVREGTVDEDTLELGYQVLPSARRRGVATAAARLVVRHAFDPRAAGGMGARRLVASTAEDNAGSNRVLDAVGFTICGRESAADLLPDGRTVDELHWELLRPQT